MHLELFMYFCSSLCFVTSGQSFKLPGDCVHNHEKDTGLQLSYSTTSPFSGTFKHSEFGECTLMGIAGGVERASHRKNWKNPSLNLENICYNMNFQSFRSTFLFLHYSVLPRCLLAPVLYGFVSFVIFGLDPFF
jgi:hypothetical protein